VTEPNLEVIETADWIVDLDRLLPVATAKGSRQSRHSKKCSDRGRSAMTDGEKMLQLAETRIGEKYVNVCVPKNNKNWHGPWDCAEYMSWLVYQVGGFLYGCVDDAGDPATVEAYTGAWQTDSKKLGKRVPKEQAAATVGAVLLRYPPAPGAMGHIVASDGKGGTVEAMGRAYGVRRGKVSAEFGTPACSSRTSPTAEPARG
jgi:hypothetical protein